jgi:hypothetical protein
LSDKFNLKSRQTALEEIFLCVKHLKWKDTATRAPNSLVSL